MDMDGHWGPKFRVGTGAYPYKKNVCNAFIVFWVGAIPPLLPVIYRHQAAYLTHPGQKTLICPINRIDKGIG
jgi:hypothetical protein